MIEILTGRDCTYAIHNCTLKRAVWSRMNKICMYFTEEIDYFQLWCLSKNDLQWWNIEKTLITRKRYLKGTFVNRTCPFCKVGSR